MAGDFVLGGFVLDHLEIPERLNFGGEQRTTIHELVGGKRVIDCMGATPAPVEWAGIFTGVSALERAIYLDGVRKAGKSIPLTFDLLSYTVVIKSLHFEAEMHNWVPYKIICEVVTDNTAPIKTAPSNDITSVLNADTGIAGTLSGLIGNSGLTTMIDGIKTATTAISTVASQAQDTINAVLQPINAAKTEIGLLITSAENTIQNVSTFGGLLPNTLANDYAGGIMDSINSMVSADNLYGLGSVLGKMENEIAESPKAGTKITVSGTTLYKVAADQYGDASAWGIIADANGLADPIITTAKTLIIPAYRPE